MDGNYLGLDAREITENKYDGFREERV